MRTWNWDAARTVRRADVDNLVKTTGAKKSPCPSRKKGGKVLEDIYGPGSSKGHRVPPRLLRARHQGLSAVLAKIGAWKLGLPLPSYATPTSTTSFRQATETGPAHEFFLVRGLSRPRAQEQGRPSTTTWSTCPSTSRRREEGSQVAKFVKAYKDFYKRDFPYDQAPLLGLLLRNPRLHAVPRP